MSLVGRASARHLLRHPGQLGLSVLGVALGVAVVLAMDLAIQSAREAFRVSAETVTGRATHQLVGGPAGVPDSVFTLVRLGVGIREAAPVVEGTVTTPALAGRALRLLGVDPLSERPFRPWLASGGGPDASQLLAPPVGVVLSRGTATEAGVAAGDSLRLGVDAGEAVVPVVGVLTPEDDLSREGLRDLLVVDVSRGQELLGLTGRLSRVDLILPPGAPGRALRTRLEASLPPDVIVRESGTRTRTMATMIRAFDLNLTALSLLALVFGMFLIYNAMTFSVVQRRELLGTLRTLGVTRRQVFGVILGEAAAVGAVGTLVGLGLGVLLGRGLVRLVTRTLNDLYFVVSVEGLAVVPGVLIKAALLGLTATVVAALPPAWEAAGATPRTALQRSVVEERWRRLVPLAAALGTGLTLLGLVALIPRWGVVASFAALFAVLLGMALLTPWVTVVLMRTVRPAARRGMGVLGTMAARGVVTALSRTAPAVAALVVAVSVTVGLGVMISSFRGTVVRWLDQTLRADIYVSAPSSLSSRPEGVLDPLVVQRLRAAEGVAGVSTYRGSMVPTEDGELRLVAVDLDPRGERAFDFSEGDPAEALRRFRTEEGAFVSEPFAYRNRIGLGDSVALRTERGRAAFRVVGIFQDYGSDRGVVMVARRTYDRYWTDPAVTSLGLFLEEGADVQVVGERLRREAGRLAGARGTAIVVRSNRQLRARSLEVFDRTFAITGVLRALAFVVAFIGVLSALMALQLERAREFGVLRANGMTPGQLWALVTAQTGLLGATAGILAVPAGVVLAAVMIFVVNKRSFGWTLRMELGPEVVAQAVGLALAGALLAGVYPAWRMVRTPASEALRTE